MKTIPKYDQASALSVSPQVVYTWYKGSSLPRADRLVQLAELLEITPRELLDIFQQRLKPCTKYSATEPEARTINSVTPKDLKSI